MQFITLSDNYDKINQIGVRSMLEINTYFMQDVPYSQMTKF